MFSNSNIKLNDLWSFVKFTLREHIGLSFQGKNI